jgi:hypothetical protein
MPMEEAICEHCQHVIVPAAVMGAETVWIHKASGLFACFRRPMPDPQKYATPQQKED